MARRLRAAVRGRRARRLSIGRPATSSIELKELGEVEARVTGLTRGAAPTTVVANHAGPGDFQKVASIRRSRCYRSAMAVVEREREQLHGILDEVERLDALAQAIQAGRKSEAHQAVEELRLLRIRDARPVRLALAAELLAVSVPTVKAWADEGVLEWRDGSPQRVSLGSVLHVDRSSASSSSWAATVICSQRSSRVWRTRRR